MCWHSGHDAAYRAFAAYFPDQRFGIAILSNFHSINPMDLGKKIVDIYLSGSMSKALSETSAMDEGRKSKSERPFPINKKQLAHYSGDYRSEELETEYHLLVVGDRLMIRHWRNEDVFLTPIGPDQFSRDQEWTDRILFLRNPDAGISGFRISAGRVRSLLFTTTNR